MPTSKHYSIDRQKREQIITELIGLGELHSTFEEKGRLGDDVVVELSTTGILSFYVKRTHYLITRKIARPNQLRHFFGEDNVPEDLLKLAIEHKRSGINEY